MVSSPSVTRRAAILVRASRTPFTITSSSTPAPSARSLHGQARPNHDDSHHLNARRTLGLGAVVLASVDGDATLAHKRWRRRSPTAAGRYGGGGAKARAAEESRELAWGGNKGARLHFGAAAVEAWSTQSGRIETTRVSPMSND